MAKSKGGQYDGKNVAHRLETSVRHDQRAREEHDTNLTQMPFIKKVDVYFYEGKASESHREYTIHVVLKTPILFNVFKKVIMSKLRGVIIE